MKKRIYSILWIFTVLLVAVLIRTAYIQVWDGPNTGTSLAAKALRFRSQVIPGEEFYRGEILDRNLLSLTDSGIRPTLMAFPASIDDISQMAQRLETLLGITASEVEFIIKKGQDTHGSRTPLIIKANLEPWEVRVMQSQKLSGISVIPIKTRYGPKALANHLIGHLNSIDEEQWRKISAEKRTIETNPSLATAYRINDEIGVTGLEGKYERVLKGSQAENRIVAIADGNGRVLQGVGYKIQASDPDPWRNHLVLTLDRRYQEIVEMVMDKYIARGAVVVLDIPTGDVLALASRPNYNQNNVGQYLTGVDEFIDRTERVAFYPGSVFKMIVAAGVLEEGLISPEEIFECSGRYQFSDQTEIKCLMEHGQVNFIDAICRSCNTTFVKLGLRLGNERLAQYASKLGFTININSWSPPAMVGNASIGQQGVLVSPLQIANLYATLARNGYYQPWRIVSEIRNYQGETIQEFPSRPPVQVIGSETSELLNKALVEATKSGSGQSAWIIDDGTAGKTGTAQVNEKEKVIAWFAGFTPVENPRLAIAVMVEEDARGQQTGLRGGEAAAPVFKEVAQKIMEIEKARE